jgi:hypothetical protein
MKKYLGESPFYSHVNSGEHLIRDIGTTEQSNNLVKSIELVHKFSNVSFVVSNIGFPSGGLFIKILLGDVSVIGSDVSSFFLVSDVRVDNVKFGVVGQKSSFSLLDGVIADGEEFVEDIDLGNVDSVGISSGLHKVLEKLVKKVKDLLGGTLVSEILGQFSESLGKMSDWGKSFKVTLELLKVSLSFFDFSERSTVEETLDESLAFSDGLFGHIVIDDELLVGRLSFGSFSGSFIDSGFSVGNELFVRGDKGFESSSLWVEGVLEMGRSDTKSNSSISKSLVDLVLKLEVLGFGPSVLFFLTTQFKVKVSDKVLEGGNEFVHWSTSL